MISTLLDSGPLNRAPASASLISQWAKISAGPVCFLFPLSCSCVCDSCRLFDINLDFWDMRKLPVTIINLVMWYLVWRSYKRPYSKGSNEQSSSLSLFYTNLFVFDGQTRLTQLIMILTVGLLAIHIIQCIQVVCFLSIILISLLSLTKNVAA